MFQNLYLDCYITGSSQPPGQEAGGTYTGREIEGFLRLNDTYRYHDNLHMQEPTLILLILSARFQHTVLSSG